MPDVLPAHVLIGTAGVEPAFSRLSGERIYQTYATCRVWCIDVDSNRRLLRFKQALTRLSYRCNQLHSGAPPRIRT